MFPSQRAALAPSHSASSYRPAMCVDLNLSASLNRHLCVAVVVLWIGFHLRQSPAHVTLRPTDVVWPSRYTACCSPPPPHCSKEPGWPSEAFNVNTKMSARHSIIRSNPTANNINNKGQGFAHRHALHKPQRS